jgi:hypothetical protein
MNQYSVFTHCYLSPVAVKHGFCWASCLFGPFWAIGAGCWRGLALYAIIIIAHVEAFPGWLSEVQALDNHLGHLALLSHLVGLAALSAWLSTFMNAWLRKSLLSKGYVEADVVTALDGAHALSVASLVRPFPPAQGPWRAYG